MKQSLRAKLDSLAQRLEELNRLLSAENATRDMAADPAMKGFADEELKTAQTAMEKLEAEQQRQIGRAHV